ncbi:IclR family transcriptional regulator [Allosalinactinospora lopnorensis]|uniref:IclR family transcriptional regulator n=1 Tax=Allosalinactinospora lopnorensis TaxID=1352348 RepID=UPI000623CA27|nr:IclR family transcriptional regulator [Allosalinactinospora lopnorensis]
MVSTVRRSVLERALRILDTFGAEAESLNLSELSRRADVPLSTTFRIVSELTRWGALERTEDGSYRIGLKLWEVACLAPRAAGVRRVALPFMQDLYETTHQSVHLAVREGDQVVFVERLIGHDAVPSRPRVGGRYALHATAVGLVLLAHAPVELQENILAGPLRSFTPYTYREPARLRQALADVRRTGFAVSDRQINTDLLSVAAAIHGPDDQVAAALSLVVPYREAHFPLLSQLVRTTTRGIARALGAPSARGSSLPQPVSRAG